MKTIEITIGYKEVLDNGTEHYYCGHSQEGYIYKDEDAFKSKTGVCYIPEVSFDDTMSDEYILATSENSYDYATLYDVVKTAVTSAEIQVCDEFIAYITEDMFNELDWCCPETWLNEVDFEGSLTDWLVEETKKHLTARAIKERSHRPDEDQTFGVVLCWMRDNLGVTKKSAWDAAWKVLDDYKLENKHY